MAAAAVKLAARIFPSLRDQSAADRRGRNDRAHRDVLRRRPRALRRTARSSAPRPPRASTRSRSMRSLGERLHEYDIVVSCTASSLPISARDWSSARLRPAPAPDVHGRPRGAARYRAGGAARRRISLYGRRSRGHRERQLRRAPLGARAGRGDHRDPGRAFHALDAAARGRAAHPRAARRGRTRRGARSSSAPEGARGAKTRRRCSRRCRASSPTS